MLSAADWWIWNNLERKTAHRLITTPSIHVNIIVYIV